MLFDNILFPKKRLTLLQNFLNGQFSNSDHVQCLFMPCETLKGFLQDIG